MVRDKVEASQERLYRIKRLMLGWYARSRLDERDEQRGIRHDHPLHRSHDCPPAESTCVLPPSSRTFRQRDARTGLAVDDHPVPPMGPGIKSPHGRMAESPMPFIAQPGNGSQ
jgi:hypothetical protein